MSSALSTYSACTCSENSESSAAAAFAGDKTDYSSSLPHRLVHSMRLRLGPKSHMSHACFETRRTRTRHTRRALARPADDLSSQKAHALQESIFTPAFSNQLFQTSFQRTRSSRDRIPKSLFHLAFDSPVLHIPHNTCVPSRTQPVAPHTSPPVTRRTSAWVRGRDSAQIRSFSALAYLRLLRLDIWFRVSTGDLIQS